MTSIHKNNQWFHNKWRPTMAWLYAFTCLFDFVLAPILWNIAQLLVLKEGYNDIVLNQWTPLTLQSGGMYHMASGAIVGVTAWKRSEEKIANVADPGDIYHGAS